MRQGMQVLKGEEGHHQVGPRANVKGGKEMLSGIGREGRVIKRADAKEILRKEVRGKEKSM